MFIFLMVLAISFMSTDSLTCHQVGAGNLSIADSSTSTDCGVGSLTCVKVVDLTRGTYTKQCQSLNCTLNGVSNAVANCANTSTVTGNMLTCCCYGDGCNSAPHSASYLAILLTALSAIGFIV
ncbi:unnamed protein product [Caenorhabditis angaria]|uniref:UPAR/Ly6 domain-containing protein n=1 Tax=Caenorhabditis angaria TaxID=860376 RepID=A0A9P1IW39_9PELO|nr:unnamed protein product [Caenorhabditis angaria]